MWNETLDEALAGKQRQRLEIGLLMAIVLISAWIGLDYFLESKNFYLFFHLRFSYIYLTIVALVFSNRPFFQKHIQKIVLFNVFHIVLVSNIVVLFSENFVIYILGHGLIFLASAIIVYWPGTSFIKFVLFAAGSFLVQSYFIEHRYTFNALIFWFYTLNIWIISYITARIAYRLALSQVQMAKELEEKNELLEDLVNKKKNVVRLLCHDMNNNLTIVKMATQSIENLVKKKEIEFSPRLEKNLERITRGTTNLEGIISHARELTSLEDGKQELDLSPVRLHDIVQDALFVFDEKLTQKDIDVVFENEEAKESLFLADRVAFGQSVFNNIISNAVKFSPRGGEIKISSVRKENGKVHITIQDQGIGIPENILQNLFDASMPTSRLGTEGEKGTGYGMPLVKAYMEKFGGTVLVRSRTEDCLEGQSFVGTEFELILEGVVDSLLVPVS